MHKTIVTDSNHLLTMLTSVLRVARICGCYLPIKFINYITCVTLQRTSTTRDFAAFHSASKYIFCNFRFKSIILN